MTKLYPHHAPAIAEVARLQAAGYIAWLRYHSEPGEWQVWTEGWLVEWRNRDET